MSQPFEPDIVEQAVLYEASKLTQGMRDLRESVQRNDREAAQNAIRVIKRYLSEMKSSLRFIEREVKRIEGAP